MMALARLHPSHADLSPEGETAFMRGWGVVLYWELLSRLDRFETAVFEPPRSPSSAFAHAVLHFIHYSCMDNKLLDTTHHTQHNHQLRIRLKRPPLPSPTPPHANVCSAPLPLIAGTKT